MSQPVTIVEIAKESGVSIATVSRVMNGTAPVSEKTRQKVNDAIKKYHYTPNSLARGLINHQSMTIGIIIPDISNPYFSSMFAAFEKAAQDAGYSVFLCNTSFYSAARQTEDEPRELKYFQMLQSKNVDGILIVGGQADLISVNKKYSAALQYLAASIPVVVLGNPINGVDCQFIQRENGQGVSTAINYLYSLGHRSIAFVGGERGVGITEARLSAYENALMVLGLPFVRDQIALSDYYTPSGYTATKDLLKRTTKFTAMLTINDNVALGAYRALADAGLRIPDDVSIISCDQFFTADYFVPRLASIDQHNEQFGRFVIQVLLSAIHGIREDAQISFSPELVIRESCAACRTWNL
ncbi:MAG: LacI family transcriptional regulator [Lachnospiraceae bacterium]|nr:LacI family transcriptional regulator [Lachnospiraceae bacterium]